jgi:uncharacterized protein (TIGR00251 family)
MISVKKNDDSIEFSVRVIPRASRSEIVGEIEGAVKVRLTSPPVDGAANAELIKLLAKTLGVSRLDVRIVTGETSKAKRIRITGVTAEAVQSLASD